MGKMGQAGSPFIILLIDSSFPIRCKCGKCDVSLLKNPYECYCCHEIEECQRALEDEVVRDEVGAIWLHYLASRVQKSAAYQNGHSSLQVQDTRQSKNKYSLLATDEGHVFNFEFST